MWRHTYRCAILIILVLLVCLPVSAADKAPSVSGLVQTLVDLVTDTLADIFEDPQPTQDEEEPEDEAGPILLPGG